MADRIALFYNDCLELCKKLDSTSSILDLTKLLQNSIKKEITKLRKWICKHQDESLPPNSQNRLFNDTIMKYYSKINKFNTDDENEKELLSKYKEDCLIPLLQDYLALPEGKLTNSKIKLKGLHKLQSLTNEQSICNNSSDSSVFKVDEKEYSVCDIEINQNTNTTSATLTSETEVLENIEFNSSELSDKIRSKLYPDNGDGHDSYNEDIVVIVANNKIIRLKE